METEWVLDVNCPRKDNFADEPPTRVCNKCPHKIWEQPAIAAGLNSDMCSIVVGNKDVTEQLDAIAEKLTGTKRFTKKDGNPSSKRADAPQFEPFSSLKSDFLISVLNAAFQIQNNDLWSQPILIPLSKPH